MTTCFGRRRLCAALIVLLTACAAGAAQLRVNDAFDDTDRAPGDGVCATRSGACTLRAAVQEANALDGADEIVLPAGGYELTLGGVGENAAARGDLDVTAPLVVTGAGATRTVIVSRGAGRLFDIRTPLRVTITGVALRGGDATGEGPCGSTPFEGGGAVCGGNVSISGCTIEDNSAAYGGGLFGAVTISESIVANNRAGFGGGIVTGNGRITNSVIRENSGGLAAGVLNLGGQLTIERSAIVLNDGVGIYTSQGGRLSVRNSTISGNSGFGLKDEGGCEGPGFCTPASVAVLNNVTVTENDGGGIFALILILPEGTRFSPLSIANSIVAGNTGVDCEGVVTSLGHNIIRNAGCSFDRNGPGDLLGVDPRLLPLAQSAGTTPHHSLAPNSPAVDGGSLATRPGEDAPCEAVDQLGLARPSGQACDIGAIERDCSASPGCSPPTRPPASTPTSSPTAIAPTPTATVQPACAGDCNGDCEVTVDELVRGVNLTLSSGNVSSCLAFDRNADGEITVDELVRAVGDALSGCPGDGCPA